MRYIFQIILIFFFLTSCGSKPVQLQLKKETGYALGTTYSILYFTKTNSKPIEKSLDSLFTVVNKSMSTYIPTSDISKINNGDNTQVVDHMFVDVFKLSNEIYKATSGVFDPTVGTLVNAWGFGPKKAIKTMTPYVIDSLMQYVGFNKVKLTEKNTIQKTNPNVYLDFNAIAKGYCIDRMAVFLDSRQIDNYLIELGGELVAKGNYISKNKSWTVGIDNPLQKEERTLITSLNLKDRAMATSGNYRKFRVDSITGKKYVHTIDAFTGYTKPTAVLSASVLAPNCAMADGYATAFMAMSIDKIEILVSTLSNLDVYIIYSDDTGTIKTFATEGFFEVLN